MTEQKPGLVDPLLVHDRSLTTKVARGSEAGEIIDQQLLLLGTQLVSQLNVLLRTVRSHGGANTALDRPVAAIRRIAEALGDDQPVTLRVQEGFVFLGERHLKTTSAQMPIFAGPGRKFALAFVPPLAAGALLTAVLYRAGLRGDLPGSWLLLYGTAVVTAGAFSIQIVPLMGLCFMVLGAVSLFSPAAWGDGFMAAGFGVVQIAFGLWIARHYGG